MHAHDLELVEVEEQCLTYLNSLLTNYYPH